MLVIRGAVALDCLVALAYRSSERLAQRLRLRSVLLKGQIESSELRAERLDFGFLTGEKRVSGADQRSQHQSEQQAQ